MNIDINFLFDKPEFTIAANLTISPLAPLSMVTSVPGSYYKTEKSPDKYMLCGLFENLLNLHLSNKDRINIRKKIKGHYKKKYKTEYQLESSNVGYNPIINHLFDIDLPIILPEMIYYDDLWTQHLIADDFRHFNGCMNNSWEIENDVSNLILQNEPNDKTKYFQENKGKFSMYYRSPKRREFIVAKGDILIKLIMTKNLFTLIQKNIEKFNTGYLGTSEGWVNIEIEELK